MPAKHAPFLGAVVYIEAFWLMHEQYLSKHVLKLENSHAPAAWFMGKRALK